MQILVFDAADLPGDECLRKERWIDSLASSYVRLRADAKPNVPFRGQLEIMQLEATAVGRIRGTVQTIARTEADVAAENTDNAVLLLNTGKEQMLVEQKNKSIVCTPGEAVLIEQCAPSLIAAGANQFCNFVAVQMPRQHLGRHARRIEDRFLIPISGSALALTRAYVDTLLDNSNSLQGDVVRFAPSHMAELIAAAAAPGTMCEDGSAANSRALVRLRAIKADIRDNIGAKDLSIAAIAVRHRLNARYVQRLFEAEATTFSEFTLTERLMRAHKLLVEAPYQHLKVSEIAYSSGFSDLSYFNRAFRRRFGKTPSDVRNDRE
ncbi:AraC family transcriptional regulator [Hyphomicrobium sp. ghe19]|uniref:AraC family transcriptional regulator n=1 Tax=Hyphomicrobium sp. ghe19 TaxID=2682968 RepID=UPI001367308D|nr:Transcriptional activator NphR [Hyphomicrobium sp. ghe19]